MPSVLDPEGMHLASLRRLADFADASVIEVGCGEGRLTEAIASEASHLFAFDPDPQAVVDAKARLAAELRPRVTLRVGSAREIEIPRTQYDIVLFSWSL
jgi:16S rRNA A1518/A1519 N6-dimethyltransferase RsmA/KsgA/DIM1 with predicted DNA glycosylase/AP lyase activity